MTCPNTENLIPCPFELCDQCGRKATPRCAKCNKYAAVSGGLCILCAMGKNLHKFHTHIYSEVAGGWHTYVVLGSGQEWVITRSADMRYGTGDKYEFYPARRWFAATEDDTARLSFFDARSRYFAALREQIVRLAISDFTFSDTLDTQMSEMYEAALPA